MRAVRPLALLAFVLGSSGALVAACSNQSIGQRCDVNNGNDDCENGLICMTHDTLGSDSDLCCPPTGTDPSHPECTPKSSGGGGSGGSGGTGGSGGSGGTGGSGGSGGSDAAADVADDGSTLDAPAEAADDGSTSPDAGDDAASDAGDDGASDASDATPE